MEYLAAILGLGVMCGCALGAYGLLDAIEREDEDSTRAAERARRPDGARSRPGRQAVGTGEIATPRAPAAREPWGSVAAHADWLEGRVRALEEQLDQLVRNGQRVEGVRRTPASVVG